jgi:hypothetical protein
MPTKRKPIGNKKIIDEQFNSIDLVKISLLMLGTTS